MPRNRAGEAAQRFKERRQREDEARRLKEVVPSLRSLRIEYDGLTASGRSADVAYVRLVVLGRAPALFIEPCTDKTCKDGEHDFSDAILRGLEAGETQFGGEDRCYGTVGSSDCGRTLRFTVTATYE